MKRIVPIAAVFFLGPLGAWFGKPFYQHAMAKRLTHAAEAAEKQGDYREASRLYSLALERDSENLPILRSCAAFLSKAHHPQLLALRERISILEPNSTDDLLDYIEAAILFQRPQLARGLLRKLASAKTKNDARFYHLLSVSEFLRNELPQADAACEEAIKRDPSNKDYQINRAVIRLDCPDPAVRQAALKSLDQFSAEPEKRVTVIQALLRYAASVPMEPRHFDAWLEAGRKCFPPRDTFFTACLSALRRWRPNQFDAQLALYMKAAAAEGGSALAAQEWLTKNGLCEQALTFRKSLPDAFRSSSESLMLTAEAMYELKQVDELSTFLQTPEWKQNNAFQMAWIERVRRAGLRGEEGSSDADANWRKILVSARNDPKQLSILAQMADDWHWPKETELTLWAISDQAPSLAEDALQDLAMRTLARADGNALRQVLNRQYEANPDETVIANNLVFLCFLLKSETSKATLLSDDLCRRFPQSSQMLATRAFGRFTKGDIPEGLKLFEALDTNALKGTAPGVTYGLLLAAHGDSLAAEFLKDAERWTHFPEERALIAEARKKIGQ